MKRQINEIRRMQQLAGILKENSSNLEQDILDFWGTQQDDAAQSDGEYEAEWDTEFFISQYPEHKGMDSEIEKIVSKLGINKNSLQQYISDKNFMKSFIANAEQSHELFGDFKNMYDVYEDELSEKEVKDLLQYCYDNDLISY